MQGQAVASFPSIGTHPDVLDAMAMLARETGLVVHVIAPRGPGLIDRARQLAEQGGLTVEADLLAKTVRVRFSH